MTTRHTPGPWEVGYTDHNAFDEPYIHIYDPNRQNVAQTAPWPERSVEQADADARLIAAAPELLEACKNLRVALRGVCKQILPTELEGFTLDFAEAADLQAEATIAKAGGDR